MAQPKRYLTMAESAKQHERWADIKSWIGWAFTSICASFMVVVVSIAVSIAVSNFFGEPEKKAACAKIDMAYDGRLDTCFKATQPWLDDK